MIRIGLVNPFAFSDRFFRSPSHETIFVGRGRMNRKELKKYLAGLSVAGLLSMGGVTVPGAHAGSG